MDDATNPEEMGVEDRMQAWLDSQDGSEAPEDDPETEQPEEDEGESEEEPEEGQPEEEFTEVEYEGKSYKVPAELKDALLRQADYTRKTQEVAEARKQTEAAQQYLQQQYQLQQQFLKEYAGLQALDNQLAQFQQVNWQQLIESDPVEAMKLDHQYRQLQQYRDNQARELQARQGEAQRTQQEQMSAQLRQAAELLAKELPGWGEDLAKQIRTSAKDYGFTDDELGGITDPRAVKVLHDAMKYRQLQANKGKVQKQVQGKPPVLKPGSKATNPKSSKALEARDRLRKSGSTNDFARVLENML